MNVIHFVIGKPKLESANGVLSAVYALFKSQRASKAIDSKIVSITNSTRSDYHKTSSQSIIYFLKSFFPFFLTNDLKNFINSIDAKESVAHIHMVNIPQFYLLARILKKNNIKYIISPHGGFSANSLKRSNIKKSLFKIFFQNYINNNAERLIAFTEKDRNELIDYGISKEKICIIPNGLLFYDSIPIHIKKDKKPLSIIFIGRLDYWHKGLDLLVDAFASVATEYEDNFVTLDLVGPDWLDGKKQLLKQIKNLGIEEKVHFHGPLFGKDKINILRNSSIFVLVSRNEGMPISVLEAFNEGIPVLISKETNIPSKIFSNGACIFSELEPLSIKEGLMTMLNDKKLRDNMAALSFKYAKNEFEYDSIILKYNNLFKILIA